MRVLEYRLRSAWRAIMDPVLMALVSVAVLTAGRLALFVFVLIAHRRWKVPVNTLERLLRACSLSSPGRRDRGTRG
jgi:hypothetical protein